MIIMIFIRVLPRTEDGPDEPEGLNMHFISQCLCVFIVILANSCYNFPKLHAALQNCVLSGHDILRIVAGVHPCEMEALDMGDKSPKKREKKKKAVEKVTVHPATAAEVLSIKKPKK